jgi:hypothetical protein
MHECPHCKEQTITAFRKQFVGPLRKIQCSNCKARVSVDWFHSIVMSLFVLVAPVFFLIIMINYGLLSAAGFAILGTVAVGAYRHFVVRLSEQMEAELPEKPFPSLK